MSVAGFDVGNDTSLVALARRKGIDVVLNAESGRLTPTMVAFSPKQRFKGCIAGHNIATNPYNTINMIKRVVGKKFSDPELQKDKLNMLYKLVQGPNDEVLMQVNYLGEEKTFTPTQVMGMLLGELKTIAETDQGAGISDCVIGVPVYFTEFQRRAMLEASQIAGLNCLRLMPETTATALAYGIYKTDLPETDPVNVAFVDVGEATFQCCIVAFKKGQLKVLAHGYDSALGGRDLDQVLVAHFAAEFKAKRNLDVYANPRALLRMRVAVEKLKKILSANPEAPLNVECLMEDHDFHSKMTREQLEELAVGTISRVHTPLETCLQASGLSVADISGVEMVGSASRIPSFVKIVQDFFQQDIRRTLNASESVARGCALQGAMLSPTFKVREFEVQDAYPHSIGFTWKKADEAGKLTDEDVSEILFPKNATSVPSTKVLTLMRSVPFDLTCFYTEPELLPPGTNPEIAKFSVGPIPPTKDGSVPKLKVTLKLNLHGIPSVEGVQSVEEQIVEVEMKDAPAADAKKDANGDAPMADGEKPAEGAAADAEPAAPQVEKKKIKTAVVVKSMTCGLVPVELQKFVEKEFEMALQDKVMEETKEKKNAVEEYVYSMRSKVSDQLSEYVTEEAKAAFSQQLEKAEDWLYDEGEDETKGVYTAKLEELQAIGNPIEERFAEAEVRPRSAQALEIVAGVFIAQCNDDKFAHIDEAEREKVIKECEAAKAWLADKIGQQEALPKSAPLAVFSKEINAKKDTIERFCKPIMSKPKPKPVEKPAEEASKSCCESENCQGEPMETEAGKAEANGEGEPTPMQADLD